MLTFPLGKEAIYLRQVVRLPSQALHLPSGEGSTLEAQAGTLLPPGEGSSLSQAGSQASQAVTSQPGAHLPPREGSSLVAGRPATSPFHKEGGSLAASPASQAGAHLSPAGENSSQAGWAGSQVTRSSRQHPRHSTRQRALQASQGNSAASEADSTVTWDGYPTPYPPNRLPQGSSPEDPNPKWVINLSSTPLTPAQRSVLAKGPNFVVAPKQPPNLEYITAIEKPEGQ